MYRRSHNTFEDYCQGKWNIGRSYASRVISAAEVVENLLPIGNITLESETVLPKNEAQARPLTNLKPKQQKEVWKAAVAANEGKQPTSAQVRQAVSRSSFDDGWSHDDEPAPPPAVSRIGGGKRYEPIVIVCECGHDCWSADKRGEEIYLVCDVCGYQHRPLRYA